MMTQGVKPAAIANMSAVLPLVHATMIAQLVAMTATILFAKPY